MTNRKTTKRALLSSVLALILCFAMLLGSTWAWFTDEATTTVNTIKSGTLDVKLYDENGADIENSTTALTFQNPTSSLDLFWEPGRTLKTNGFKVANKGNLALQYTIAINGFVGSNDAYKLTDVIDFWLVDAQANVVSLGTPVVLAPGTESGFYYLVGKMQETAGNEYQNLTLEGVTITVFATQTPYEHDANGNNTYDEGAAN
jgi:predicted ribosomally synthesized peptide with SipW-like signal peptide